MKKYHIRCVYSVTQGSYETDTHSLKYFAHVIALYGSFTTTLSSLILFIKLCKAKIGENELPNFTLPVCDFLVNDVTKGFTEKQDT